LARNITIYRIGKGHLAGIPNLEVLEQLERSMLALHSDKLKVELGFFVDRKREHDITQSL